MDEFQPTSKFQLTEKGAREAQAIQAALADHGIVVRSLTDLDKYDRDTVGRIADSVLGDADGTRHNGGVALLKFYLLVLDEIRKQRDTLPPASVN